MIFGLEFPPIENLVEWPNFIGNDWYGFNKIALTYMIAVVATVIFFVLAAAGRKLMPEGRRRTSPSRR